MPPFERVKIGAPVGTVAEKSVEHLIPEVLAHVAADEAESKVGGGPQD
jgi:hypothetical protein